MVEVEVRLLGEEVVQLILVPPRVPGPGGTAETESQLLGGVPSCFGSAQIEPVRLGLAQLERLSVKKGCWSEEWEEDLVDYQ